MSQANEQAGAGRGQAAEADLPKTAIVIPYFGAPPPWLPFFLASCARNPGFDWFLFTDFDLGEAPDNVHHVSISMDAYVGLCEEKLKLDLSEVRKDPYKLTDLKPVVGYVHSERLAEYDYWGYGDLDVVYGDLAAAYGPQLGLHDVISSHTYLLSGHLAFFRNTRSMRGLFSGFPKWREAMASPLHQAFDEKVMTQLFFQGMPDRRMFLFAPLFVSRVKVNGQEVTGHFCERFTTFNRPRLLPDGRLGRVEEWVWCDGVLTADALPDASLAYAHFSAWASGRYAGQRTGAKPWNKGGMEIDPSLAAPYDAFRITETGFHALAD